MVIRVSRKIAHDRLKATQLIGPRRSEWVAHVDGWGYPDQLSQAIEHISPVLASRMHHREHRRVPLRTGDRVEAADPLLMHLLAAEVTFRAVVVRRHVATAKKQQQRPAMDRLAERLLSLAVHRVPHWSHQRFVEPTVQRRCDPLTSGDPLQVLPIILAGGRHVVEMMPQSQTTPQDAPQAIGLGQPLRVDAQLQLAERVGQTELVAPTGLNLELSFYQSLTQAAGIVKPPKTSGDHVGATRWRTDLIGVPCRPEGPQPLNTTGDALPRLVAADDGTAHNLGSERFASVAGSIGRCGLSDQADQSLLADETTKQVTQALLEPLLRRSAELL